MSSIEFTTENGVDLTIEYDIEDMGIGAYECHGAFGNQVSMEAVLLEAHTDDGAVFDLEDLSESDRIKAEQQASEDSQYDPYSDPDMYADY